MRLLSRLAAFGLTLAIGAAHATPGPQAAYVERRGMLEVDAHCHLFTANLRYALEASAGQARGALLRSGWTQARLAELEQATAAAARARPCDDPRNAEAVTQARAGFASWARMASMSFSGAERSWLARRYPDPVGWRLRQDISGGAVFGVREHDGAQRLTFAVPWTAAAAPSAAQVLMRDGARARANLDVPGRVARGLQAGLPSPASTQTTWASARRIETIAEQRLLVFTFPDSAFQAMLTLDPRETVEIRLGAEGERGRYLVEVGDIAAARAFLAIRADR